ncbi:MAG: NADH-quinone oxidoreductase subunit B family protein [Candidatus Aenigmarchaeota archaeon]|nr:NADH-quinone oxidoreductase subunit B family protein [Candidatus Aenigmarchaeota archaeon]
MKENIIKLKPDKEKLKKKVKKSLLEKFISYNRKKSPWVLHLGGSGCNGCSIEIVAALTPKYDVERFGIVAKGSPRHADIIIIEGPVGTKMKDRIKTIYEQMPDPKYVIAYGTCPITKGVFYDGYNVEGPLDKIIPVDIYVPGCPPRPEALIDAIVKAMEKM